jgi:hypothetical protein
MRLALAALMILHGIAHLVGFAGSWHLGELPYKTTVLGGRVDLGDTGIRAAGLLWLTAAMAFVVVGAGTALDYSWWAKAALYVTLASLALTIMEFPEAKLGLVVNLAILAVLVVSTRATA